MRGFNCILRQVRGCGSPFARPHGTHQGHDGRLPYAFSCGRPTLYCSDIAAIDKGVDSDDLDAPGRLTELRAAGRDDFVAKGVMVAEVAARMCRDAA